MRRTFLAGLCTATTLLAAACVGGTTDSGTARAASASMSPPAGYEKVSGLVKLPDFLPGLGTLFLEAFFSRDIPVVQGCAFVIASIYVSVSLLLDLAYGMVDPRVELS